jgi:hypothetical protein
MLKHLPATALSYLRDIIDLCLESSFIPSQWKDATIYPIPKPHEWNCLLQNTRPITLLDTARKLLTRIMYRRLSQVLVEHQVLTGKNFAGLPGCSCDPPVATLEAILRDASAKSNPLFIFQQDISKAFDSMDPNMLRLAMERLKIPSRFINLTLELFTGRWNTVITAYGPSAPYKVNIGIDQGEVISPLLWVIYIDPLLTALNNENPTPYQIASDPAVPAVSTSTLSYMDDTNLISTSTHGLSTMLKIAQEFYDFNNTKINFKKAILVCNRDPVVNSLPLPSAPAPFRFDLGASSFDITPLPKTESFRFLGVWFTLSLSSSYVKKQCTTEYALFSGKLRNKRLTGDQLRYLHNSVLLPKVDYRLKATILSDRNCSAIMAPFRKVFKHTIGLTVAVPNAFLHSRDALGLIDLFERQMINHTSRLSATFQLDNFSPVKRLLLHRLHDIQIDLHLPFSPLLIEQFSAFEKTNTFRFDFIFRFLALAQPLGISFARSLPASPTSSVLPMQHTPLYTLFQDQPILYQKSLHLFKKHRISFLSDCLDKDSLAVLPFRDIIKKNSVFPPSQIVPKWYRHVVQSTAVSPDSLRLSDTYKARSQRLDPAAPMFSYTPPSDHGFSHIYIPRRAYQNSFWSATWDSLTDAPVFGRVLKNAPSRVVVQHWIRKIVYQDSDSTVLTPSSQPIRLIECPGCFLHDPSCIQVGNNPPDSRLINQSCLFSSTHETFVDLKFLQQGIPQDGSDGEVSLFLRSSYFHLSFSLRSIFSPHIVPPRLPLVSPDTSAPLINAKLDHGLYFISSSASHQVLVAPRSFMKSLFNAVRFDSLLTLQR